MYTSERKLKNEAGVDYIHTQTHTRTRTHNDSTEVKQLNKEL